MHEYCHRHAYIDEHGNADAVPAEVHPGHEGLAPANDSGEPTGHL